MKGLKKYWDEIHPEFNFFTEKQLRQQPTFVENIYIYIYIADKAIKIQ